MYWTGSDTRRISASWTKLQEGYTPREHKEMVDQKEKREYQEERRTQDEAFRSQQRKEI